MFAVIICQKQLSPYICEESLDQSILWIGAVGEYLWEVLSITHPNGFNISTRYMLKHLLIKNYVLIQALEMAPSAHLNIITGETGAGKSIMLGALGLLMGKRAEGNVHYSPGSKCVIEGTFDLTEHPHTKALFTDLELDYENPCLVRRELSASGKSRSFINDTPVNLDALKRLGAYLMDIHSQHDTQLLGSAEVQLQIVDAYAQNEHLKGDYSKAYKSYQKSEQALKQLEAESAQATKEHDFNLHQLEELKRVKLDDLNQEELEEELEMLENAEMIKGSLNISLDALSRSEFSVEDNLKSVLGTLQQLQRFGKSFEQLYERVNSAMLELMDVNLEIEREDSDLLFDYDRIQALKEELNLLYTLQKKHQAESAEELIGVRDELQQKVDRVLNFDDEVRQAQEARDLAYEVMIDWGKKLSVTRQDVMPTIEQELNALLGEVGIPNGRVSMSWAAGLPTPQGMDEISLLFSANKGVDPAPLKQVASGGEFSRLMLCIKYVLASKIAMPTIIFDEIDTGVSGEVALRVGRMMEQMAKEHQLMAITHLPQIASKGDAHYYVYKDHSAEKTISRLKELSEKERVEEVAQMIGGANPSETAYNSAKELMNS